MCGLGNLSNIQLATVTMTWQRKRRILFYQNRNEGENYGIPIRTNLRTMYYTVLLWTNIYYISLWSLNG